MSNFPFIRCQEGATAAEYAMVAGLIAAVIAASVAAVGGAVVPLFDNAELQEALAE